jgi:hypothetical protein
MSPTLQNTRAQRNTALARSSSSSGHVVNVQYWHLADIGLLIGGGHECTSTFLVVETKCCSNNSLVLNYNMLSR